MSDPISFLSLSVAFAAAAIPLILKVVPPNRLYGLRTPRTLSDRELWFRANQFAGWAVFMAAAVSAAAFIAAPELAAGRSFRGLLVFAVPLVIALAVSVAYARKLSGREGK